MNKMIGLVLLTVLGFASFFLAPVAATAQDSRKINRSVEFLEKASRGKDVLGYMHFGGKFVSHEALSTHSVVDSSKKLIPGYWAVKVNYEWTTAFGDNTSTAVFYFDELGDIYDVKVTTTSFVAPFELANATIQVLGNVILEAMGTNINKDDRAEIKKAVDNADSKQLMITALNIQRRLGL